MAVKRHALPIIAALLFLSSVHATQISSQNYTTAQADSYIYNASQYLQTVNESGYLIFTPNLGQAYGYLASAKRLNISNPSASVYYASEAYSSAEMEYARISYYRSISVPVVGIFTAVMALLLYHFMRPVEQRRARSRG